MYIEWEYGTSSLDYRCGYQVTGSSIVYSSWYHAPASNDAVSSVKVSSSLGSGRTFFDNAFIYNDLYGDTASTTGFGSIPFNTRINNAVITGVSSTTVTANVGYFLDTSEYTANNRPDTLVMSVRKDNLINDETVGSQMKFIAPLADGYATSTINYSVALADGDYNATFFFWNVNTNLPTFAQTSVFVKFTVSGGAVTTSTVVGKYNNTSGSSLGIVQCVVGGWSQCVIEVAGKLIASESISLGAGHDFLEFLATKYPFNYFDSFGESISTYQATTSSVVATYTVNVPFLGASFEILSESVIDRFYPDQTRIMIRNLMKWALVLGFIVMVFFTVGSMFNRSQRIKIM